MFREDNFLDLRPPKSPKRFFASAFSPLAFSPFKSSASAPPRPPPPTMPLPPTPTGVAPHLPSRSGSTARKSHTPSSSTSSFGHGLGSGAQVVRTPSEALRGVPQLVTLALGHDRPDAASPAPNDGKSSPPPPARPPRPQRSGIEAQPSVISRPSAANGISVYSGASIDPGADAKMDTNATKRDGRMSMSSSPKLQSSLVTMSTFDPFGVGPTILNDGGKTEQCKDVLEGGRQVKSPECGSAAEGRRATIKSPARPVTPSPFHAILKAKTTSTAPMSKSETLITLEFGYSLDDTPKNTSVCLPWAMLAKAGGHLVQFVKVNLSDEEDQCECGVPDMTDGSSAEDSDRESGTYDLNGLLRDEYLRSLWISSPPPSPSQLHFPLPPPLPPISALRSCLNPKTGKKRAATRNQYIQQAHFPSPGSTFISPTSLAVRRHAPEPRVQIEEADGGGALTELTVLITRDASVYHLIAGRLATDEWTRMDSVKRKRVEEECRWLGMSGLAEEMAELRGQSMVLRGGSGYI